MKRSWFLGLYVLLAAVAPLAASVTVNAYVPLAANLPLGADRYRTLLIATNTGTAPATLGVAFLASGTDGATATPQPANYGIAPGSTVRLYDAVPAGARGLFELSGPPEILVSARIEALAANGNVLASAQVPVVAAGGAVAAGQHVELVGLEQSAGGAGSDFGLLTLGTGPAHCTVAAFRADGSALAGPVQLNLLALAATDFTGALPRLGQTSVKDVRFDVTCDQTFVPYALVYRSGGPETVILSPAARLDGTLTPDDDGSLHFNLPGKFADGTTYTYYDLPLGSGVQYAHARIEFDLFLNRWHTPFPNNPNYETVASFRRAATKRQDRVLYWGLILKGSGDYRTLLDLGLPPGAPGPDGTTLKSGKGPWQERTTYHLVMDYDTQAGTIVFEAYQGGTLVQRMTGPINNFDISNVANQPVRIDFSAAGVGDGAYFPTTGWLYSNLTVTLTPRPR